MPPNACEQWNDRQVYWATLAYARWWLAVDGPFLAAIDAGGFTPKLLRRVAIRYNVNRGIPQTGATDSKAISVIKLLNEAAQDWPDGLNLRAEKCLALAEKALGRHDTGTLQVSGMSKFMWFVKPDGWTVFDSFARKGLAVSGNDRRALFLNFYKTLEDQGFDDLVQTMRPVIAESLLPDLPAERIIDSLLMARGGRGCEQHEIDESAAFLALLPPDFRKSLDGLAIKLDRELRDSALVRAA